MSAKRREPDWIIDAEIALYKGRGWTWEEIGQFFGMSGRSAQRRCERYERYRTTLKKRKESMNG